MKYLTCLKGFTSIIHSHIEHPYTEDASKKSMFLNMELIDASENSSDGMIQILRRVHELAVPHTEGQVLERVVFGGDVLTNERAFSGQQALLNGTSGCDQLAGLIHRPEGLHRVMNFAQEIYREYYKEASMGDRGTLHQLRNLINRRDVYGTDSVIEKFRPHHQFLEDVLDAVIVAAAMAHFGLTSTEAEPTKNKPHVLLPSESAACQLQWLMHEASMIRQLLLAGSQPEVDDVRTGIEDLDTLDSIINEMNTENGYRCDACGKTYKRRGTFVKHLKSKHPDMLPEDTPMPDVQNTSVKLSNAHYVTSSLVKMCLILRDTYDAYRMCDGNRVMRNAKF